MRKEKPLCASLGAAEGRWRGQLSNELGHGDSLGEAPEGGTAEGSQAGPGRPGRCGHGELGGDLKCAVGGRAEVTDGGCAGTAGGLPDRPVLSTRIGSCHATLQVGQQNLTSP